MSFVLSQSHLASVWLILIGLNNKQTLLIWRFTSAFGQRHKYAQLWEEKFDNSHSPLWILSFGNLLFGAWRQGKTEDTLLIALDSFKRSKQDASGWAINVQIPLIYFVVCSKDSGSEYFPIFLQIRLCNLILSTLACFRALDVQIDTHKPVYDRLLCLHINPSVTEFKF